MAAYLYCAPLMSLLCADASDDASADVSDDASVHSDCIVPQSFSINRPFLIHFNIHTSEINKNSYFYSVSRNLCLGVIFLGVLQQVISTITLVCPQPLPPSAQEKSLPRQASASISLR